MLWLAFVFAQTASTLIAIYGFNGYPGDGEGTQDGTDLYGCGWDWAILCWIWSVITVLLLDPIKVACFYIVDKLPIVRRKITAYGRTHRVGHPVYGNFQRGGFGLTAWPTLDVETPGPDEILKVAPMMKPASLDEIESPWSALTTHFKKGGTGGTDWRELKEFAKRLEDEEFENASETTFSEDTGSEDEDEKNKKKNKKKKENVGNGKGKEKVASQKNQDNGMNGKKRKPAEEDSDNDSS